MSVFRQGICSSARKKKAVISARVGAQTRVRWWREEVLLADSNEQKLPSPERVTLYSNGSLRVLHVQREDSGEYVCQAIRPSPWGHVTQVHEIEVMCEYTARYIYIYPAISVPHVMSRGIIRLLYTEADRRVERIRESFEFARIQRLRRLSVFSRCLIYEPLSKFDFYGPRRVPLGLSRR